MEVIVDHDPVGSHSRLHLHRGLPGARQKCFMLSPARKESQSCSQFRQCREC
jgi:hypothetical protein